MGRTSSKPLRDYIHLVGGHVRGTNLDDRAVDQGVQAYATAAIVSNILLCGSCADYIT